MPCAHILPHSLFKREPCTVRLSLPHKVVVIEHATPLLYGLKNAEQNRPPGVVLPTTSLPIGGVRESVHFLLPTLYPIGIMPLTFGTMPALSVVPKKDCGGPLPWTTGYLSLRPTVQVLSHGISYRFVMAPQDVTIAKAGNLPRIGF